MTAYVMEYIKIKIIYFFNYSLIFSIGRLNS